MTSKLGGWSSRFGSIELLTASYPEVARSRYSRTFGSTVGGIEEGVLT
jgi:hypothetical protein